MSLLFLAPAALVFLLFRYFPVLMAARVSLWSYSLLGGYGEFVGIGNYAQALHDPIAVNAVVVTVLFLLLKVPAQVVLGLALALFLQRQSFITSLLRTAIFIPAVMSMVVVSTVWSMLYNEQTGLINSTLSALHLPAQPFLNSSLQALPAIAVMSIWKDIGLTVLILIAGLAAIPKSYYDAAAVDGAGPRRTFTNITLPLLVGPLGFILVTQGIEALQLFVPVYAMTQGGPGNATRTFAYYIYEAGFQLGNMGYASALTVFLVVVIVAIGCAQLVLVRRRMRIA